MSRSKRGQEEMVGFVLIVVLVVVIAVVFLGISLRKDNLQEGQPSRELASFIFSISYYTTDCEIPETEYKSIGDLVRACYNGRVCSDGRATCGVLEDNLREILENTYVVEKGSFTRYYRMNLMRGEGDQELIAPIEKTATGEYSCPGTNLENYHEFPVGSSEDIRLSLEICQAE